MVGYDGTISYRYVLVDGLLDDTRSLLHTLFHILGRYHEHQRLDREQYIYVMKENILPGTNTHKELSVFKFNCAYSFTDEM